MSDIEIKNGQGKVVGKHKVAEPIVAIGPIKSVLHRMIVAEQANARQGTHSAKTRSKRARLRSRHRGLENWRKRVRCDRSQGVAGRAGREIGHGGGV